VTLEWLLDHVFVCPSGCWLWAGADSGERGRGHGYPKYNRRREGGTRYVHRDVHEEFNGPIPEGYQVDHTCARHDRGRFRVQRRRCVRPEHLEAVPGVVNQRRKQR
jgi:HNH endonuclease